jgi:replicative DNA helicase
MSEPPNPSEYDAPNFQFELLAHLIAQESIGTRFATKLTDAQFFKKPWMRVVWGRTCDLYARLGTWPKKPAILNELESLYDETNLLPEDREDVDAFLEDAFDPQRSFDNHYFTIEAERFIEKNLARKICDRFIKGFIGSTEEVINELQNVQKKIRSSNIVAVDPYDDLHLIEIDSVMKTGITQLDAMLPGGGLSTKRTLFFLAFTSNGKSTMLRTMEKAAAMNREKVLTITLEDSINQVATKLKGNLAGIPISLLNNPKYRSEEMINKIKAYQTLLRGYHRIVDPFDTNTNGGMSFNSALSVEDIVRIVDYELTNGFEFKLLSIDYINRIRCDKRTGKEGDESRELRIIAEQLKDRLAKQFDIAVVTCGQARGDTSEKSVLEIADMARSKEAAWAFDTIATLGARRSLESGFNEPSNESTIDSQEEKNAAALAAAITPEDLLKGRCPMHLVTVNVPKVRDGMTGKFPIYADFCYGRFVEYGDMVQTITGPRKVSEIIKEMQNTRQLQTPNP